MGGEGCIDRSLDRAREYPGRFTLTELVNGAKLIKLTFVSFQTQELSIWRYNFKVQCREHVSLFLAKQLILIHICSWVIVNVDKLIQI